MAMRGGASYHADWPRTYGVCQRVGEGFPPSSLQSVESQELWNLSGDLIQAQSKNDVIKMEPMDRMLTLEQEDQVLFDQLFPENTKHQPPPELDFHFDEIKVDPPKIQQLDRWNSLLAQQPTFDQQIMELNNIQVQDLHKVSSYKYSNYEFNLFQPLNSPNNSNTGSCDTKEFLNISLNGWGDSEESQAPALNLPLVSDQQLQPLPMVSRPKEVPKRSPASSNKRKKPEVDLTKITDIEEFRRQKRLMKNRRTAATSRARKRQYLEDLHNRLENAIVLHNEKVELIEKLKRYVDSMQQQCHRQRDIIEELKEQNERKDFELKNAKLMLARQGIDPLSGEMRYRMSLPIYPQQFPLSQSRHGSSPLLLKQEPVIVEYNNPFLQQPSFGEFLQLRPFQQQQQYSFTNNYDHQRGDIQQSSEIEERNLGHESTHKCLIQFFAIFALFQQVTFGELFGDVFVYDSQLGKFSFCAMFADFWIRQVQIQYQRCKQTLGTGIAVIDRYRRRRLYVEFMKYSLQMMRFVGMWEEYLEKQYTAIDMSEDSCSMSAE
eukprot:TRINITY_DN2314_c1_g1_i3.p1 TRINITY_DN2314_c1_g1~~TRINITY_DN2314_c1_g1_i3.p1  ORF type:complete len:547 (-),score=49.32 TRINITY_DN2314_c1_g1_i3:1285-2925(-)